ncbi:MAG: hypothetical protein VX154_00845 [Pseudomonadota bacterium]|nr:hypothetical protein [Pseudomonadota bacterium]
MKNLCKMATVAIVFAGLALSANAETFDENYNTMKTDQYVFDVHAGHQYTFQYEYAGKISVCSVSQNDGYGAFTFMVFPDRSTGFDLGFEKIDGEYKSSYKITCTAYNENYAIDGYDVEQWKKGQASVRSHYGKSGFHDARTLDNVLGADVTYESNYELEIGSQAVGDIYRISNPNDDLLACKVETSNSNYPLYMLIMPNNMQTFQSLAASDGSAQVMFKNCRLFPLNNEIALSALRTHLIK